ncbi:MAG: TIGR00303 family protein [Acidilobaceae archaeon]
MGLRVFGSVSLEYISSGVFTFVLFIGSTRTSTIPSISIAGASPEATLYTPALDAEYLVLGRPLTFNIIPVTPDGIPTPALLSRAALSLTGLPVLIVDTGSFIKPKVPYVSLPSSTVGEVISSGRALPEGTSARLYSEARLLGSMLGGHLDFIIGESIPGGTTTAMAIMEALGFNARGRVSSSSPYNPHSIKGRVVDEGLRSAGIMKPEDDVFKVNDSVGDPLHISIAGFISGALERGSKIILAGGTQMCSVLAILRKLKVDTRGNLIVATTRWILEDKTADMQGLLSEISKKTPLVAANIDFKDSPYTGLRKYEEGYVKEGVGAGGLIVFSLIKGHSMDTVKNTIYREYERLASYGVNI